MHMVMTSDKAQIQISVCGLVNATCKTRDLKQVVKSRLNIAIRKQRTDKICRGENTCQTMLQSEQHCASEWIETFFDCLELDSGDGIKRRGREINWTYQTGCGILYSSFPIVFPSFPKWSMLISLNWAVTCGPDCTSAASLLTAFVDIRETCRS